MTFETKSFGGAEASRSAGLALPNSATILLLLVSLASGAWAFGSTDASAVLSTLKTLPGWVVATAIAILLVGGVGLSTIRFQSVFRSFQIDLGFLLALRANVLGILGGLLFFQIVGQTLARGAILRREGVSGSAVVLANLYERLTALASLSALALVSAYYLHDTAFSLERLRLAMPSALGLWAIAGLACTFLAFYRLALPRRLRSEGVVLIRHGALNRGLLISAISLAMHLSTLLVFLLLTHALAPGVDLLPLSAAITLVMFAASLPISFAGWGMRELTAVYALGAVGVPATVAIAVSVAVGCLSTAVALLTGGVVLAWSRKPKDLDQHSQDRQSVKSSRTLDHLTACAVPMLAAALVWTQLYLEVGEAKINLNLADPVAVIGGLVFLLKYLQQQDRSAAWRVPHFEAIIAALTLVLGVALVTGWMKSGFSSLAFSTRFAGWFILLAYMATGALIVSRLGSAGYKILLRTLVVCGLVVMLFDMATLFAVLQGTVMIDGYGPTMRGLTQNSNAFALQVMMVIGILGVSSLHAHRASQTLKAPWVLALLLAICGLSIDFSASRTGAISAVVLMVFMVAMRWLKFRTALMSLAMVGAVLSLPTVINVIQNLTPGASNSAFLFVIEGRASSDTERMFSIVEGLKLWLAQPIFGGGLGAFANLMNEQNHAPLIIHNSSVWLLAETGLVGFLTFAIAFAMIGKAAWQSAMKQELEGKVLVMALLAFLLFQMPHDVLFQRILWVVLGASVARGFPRSKAGAAEASVNSTLQPLATPLRAAA